MKKGTKQPFVFSLILSALIAGMASQVESKTVAVKSAGLATHVSGSANIKLRQFVSAGSRIKTGANGRVELTFRDGTRLRIGSNSDFQLVQYKASGSAAKLNQGRIWSSGKRKGGKKLVQGKHATTAVMGTVYDMYVSNQATATTVLDGDVGIHRPFDQLDNLDDVLEKTPELKEGAKRGDYTPPTVIPNPVHEIPPPVKVVPGPYQVSLEEWLQIVKNQRIEMQDGGKANVSVVDPEALKKQDEWVSWNQGMDAKPVQLKDLEE